MLIILNSPIVYLFSTCTLLSLSMSLAMLKDNVIRYFLASSPTEHLTMAKLMEEIAHRGKGPHAPPVDNIDSEVMANALIQ